MASHVASSSAWWSAGPVLRITALISADSCLMFDDSSTANNKILDRWGTYLRTRTVGGFIFDVTFDVHAGRSMIDSKGWQLPDVSGYDCVLVVTAGNNFMKGWNTVLSQTAWQYGKQAATISELIRIGGAVRQHCGGFVFIGKADDWPHLEGASADDRQRYDSMLRESIEFCAEGMCIDTAFLDVRDARGGRYFSGLPYDFFSFRNDSGHFAVESAEPLFRYLHSLLFHACLRSRRRHVDDDA